LVKSSARGIIERYYLLLTLDFHTNKKIVDDCAELCAEVPAKRTRNKIAGFVTQLMKKLHSVGYVHGVNLDKYLDTALEDVVPPDRPGIDHLEGDAEKDDTLAGCSVTTDSSCSSASATEALI